MRSKFKWIFTLLVALTMQFSFAQEKTVTGVVSDATGPLSGVNVVVKGTKTGTQTDINGKYTIKAKQGDVLVISFVGMKDATVTVGASNVANIKMQDGIDLIDVVVQTNMGYFKRDANKITAGISTISGDELTKQAPNVSIDNALQGRAAGVQVSQLNGQPGSRAYVSIRGAVSITGGNASASYVVDGAFVSALEASSISSSDVESVTALKDGASAAIYGVKGGNGVIVITTKKGSKNGKAKFEVSNSIGYTEKIADPYRMMSAEEKLRYEKEVGEGVGYDNFILSQTDPNQAASQLALLNSYNHDWKQDLLKKGFLQNFNFSMSGGDEKFSNYFSLGYNKNTGIINGLNGFDRISARYSSDYKASNSIKLGMAIGGSYERTELSRDRNNVQNPFRAMYDYNSYEPLYDRDPTTGAILYDSNGDPVYNPTHQGLSISEAIKNNTSSQKYFRVFARPTVDVTLYKDLVFTSRFSMNYERRLSESYTKAGSQLDLILNPTPASGTGSKSDSGWDDLDFQWTNSLNYKFKLGEKHNFITTLLYEYFENNFRSYALTRKGFPNPDIDLGGGTVASPKTATTDRTQYSTISYFANVDYDYNGKYLLSADFRRDGSSSLGVNNRWENAKGGSIGWMLSKEDFFKVKFINSLKFRASYGELNSTNGVGNYTAQSTYSYVPYSGQPATTYTGGGIGNPDLKFEKAKKIDIGLDSRLFHDRISFAASYFKDTRSNYIYSGSTTNGTGWGTILNAGEWTAKGFEIELKAFVIKNENTNLSFYVNAAKIDRKIDALPEGDIDRGFTKQTVGESPDSYYLVHYAGVDKTNGDALYADKDGNVSNVFSEDNRVLSGKSPYAKYEGGFGMDLVFHGFDVTTDFVFKSGNYSYNLRDANNFSDGNSINSNQAVGAFDYWTATNPNASLPAPFQLNSNNIDQTSDRFLQDASYIRFRSLNVGYTFSKKILKKLPLEKVRIYAQLQNLYTWTKFNGDPEIGIGNNEASSGASTTNSLVVGQFLGYTYPTVKSVLFGLTINF
jgi:TonB-linked SusC/RagA family outer membrane protein